LIKKAKTDTDRRITYEPERRPEVANLLLLASLCTGESPVAIGGPSFATIVGHPKLAVTTTPSAAVWKAYGKRRQVRGFFAPPSS